MACTVDQPAFVWRTGENHEQGALHMKVYEQCWLVMSD